MFSIYASNSRVQTTRFAPFRYALLRYTSA